MSLVLARRPADPGGVGLAAEALLAIAVELELELVGCVHGGGSFGSGCGGGGGGTGDVGRVRAAAVRGARCASRLRPSS